MKDYLLPAMIPHALHLAQAFDPSTFPLWERLLEKWGIGAIGLGLFGVVAWWTYRREEEATVKREKREEEARAERIALAKENNALSLQIIQQSADHSRRLETLIRESTEAEKETHRHLAELVAHLRLK